MTAPFTIHVGTIGQGLWRSTSAGDAWQKCRGVGEAAIRSLAVFPDDPARLLAGSDHGLLASGDDGESWQSIAAFEPNGPIRSLTIDRADSNTIFAGGQPGLRRSRDGGQSWQDLPIEIRHDPRAGVPRTTAVVIDPLNAQRVYVGIEVDGVHKSMDGGDSWSRSNPIGPEFFQSDVHCMGRAVSPDGTVMYATNPFGVARSDDEGESWSQHEFPPLTASTQRAYSRGMLVKHDDPDTIFVAAGDWSPGEIGVIQRSTDGGASWSPCHLPTPPNSMMYWLASAPSAPDVIAAASLHGYVYLSEDGGETWRKLDREFGEIRALAISSV